MYAHHVCRHVFRILALATLVLSTGCQSSGLLGRYAARSTGEIRRVHCIYDQDPWLNLDLHGDRDPEGIQYRLFLDTGDGYGVLRDGMFHIAMYRIDRLGIGNVERVKISDWHYATNQIHTIKHPGMLGEGYHLRLRWALKNTAGKEIELITTYEAPDGASVRSGTKRFRVPHYPA